MHQETRTTTKSLYYDTLQHHRNKEHLHRERNPLNGCTSFYKYDTPTKTRDKDGFVVYVANFTTTSGMKGWVEFEIWKEEI